MVQHCVAQRNGTECFKMSNCDRSSIQPSPPVLDPKGPPPLPSRPPRFCRFCAALRPEAPPVGSREKTLQTLPASTWTANHGHACQQSLLCPSFDPLLVPSLPATLLTPSLKPSHRLLLAPSRALNNLSGTFRDSTRSEMQIFAPPHHTHAKKK